MNPESGQEFKEQYNNALQYFMSRCQHHIHKLATDPKAEEEAPGTQRVRFQEEQKGMQTRSAVDKQSISRVEVGPAYRLQGHCEEIWTQNEWRKELDGTDTWNAQR